MLTVLHRQIAAGRLAALVVFAALCASLVAPAPARAAVVPMTDAQVAAAADAIVLVRVGEPRSLKMPAATPDSPFDIVTDVPVTVLRTIKGSRPRRLTLRQPGGEVGSTGLFVSEVPRLRDGELCYLALDAQDRVVGGPQGRYPVAGPDLAVERRLGARVPAKPVRAPRTSVAAIAPSPTIASLWDPAAGISLAATTTVFSSDFDAGTTGWTLSAGTTPRAYWGRTTYALGGNATGKLFYAGQGDGTSAVVPGSPVTVQVNAFADHAPVSLAGYNRATLEYDYYTDLGSQPTEWLFAVVSTDTVHEYYVADSLAQRASGGWKHASLDLSYVVDYWGDWAPADLSGASTLYVSLAALDLSTADAGIGVFVDDVRLTGDTAAGPSISGVAPATARAGVGDTLTLTGSGFGASAGEVRFAKSGGSTFVTGTIASWTPTSVEVVVPAGASSGPLVLLDSGGASSPGFDVTLGFSYSGLHQPTDTVSYRVNPNTADVADERAVIDAAMSVWNGSPYKLSDFVFSDVGLCGTTANNPGSGDAYNDIYFASTGFPQGTLAWNAYWYNPGTRVISQTDIVVNDEYTWASGFATGKYNLRNVMVHELGHTLNLSDQYGWNDMHKIMYGRSSTDAYDLPLSADDIAGIRYVYGTDSAAPTVTVLSSATHPSPASWYASRAPRFSWTATDTGGGSVTGSVWVLDQTPGTVPATASPTATQSASFSGLADGTWYLHVTSVDTYGNAGAPRHLAVNIDGTAPTGVMSLAAGAATTTATTVSVDSAMSDAGPLEMRLRVDTGSWSAWAAYAASRVATIGAVAGTHTVTAEYRDRAGTVVSRSDTIVVPGDVPVPVAPAVPSGLSAVPATGPLAVTLTWVDEASDETGYRVERDAGAGFVEVASLGADSTGWTDTAFVMGTPHVYRVRAERSGEFSAYSATATATLYGSAVVDRVSGADRYAVAASLAASGWPTGAKRVIIASGSDKALADPLSAAGLAGLHDAPILLVRNDTKAFVPDATKQRLAAFKKANGNKPLDIYIVGGTASVTAAHEATLKSYGTIRARYGGRNRYEVSAAIAKSIRDAKGAVASEAIVACGSDAAYFSHALAAGPAAFAGPRPILLVATASVPAAIQTQAARFERIVVVGGTASVAASVAAQLGAVARYPASGTDGRCVVAGEAGDAFVASGVLGRDRVLIANALPDALAGGVVAGRWQVPLLYTQDAATLGTEADSRLTSAAPVMQRAVLLGGTGSVTEACADAVRHALGLP